ncbi:hypothetical protein D3C80_1529160 [compost metagenome]
MDLIVDGNCALLLATGCGRALAVHGLGIGAYRFDIAEQIARHAQQVAAQVRQRATGMFGFAAP